MAELFCLRCDWAGESEGPACPRCAAPLYRMGRSEQRPAPPELPPARHQPPPEVQGRRGAPFDIAHGQGIDQDETILPSFGIAETGRWRVIALALTLTAVVAFALTRGGEPDPGGGDQARAVPGAPGGPAFPIPPNNPSPVPPPQCSGDATTPAAPEPARAVPAATADYYFQGSLESSLGTAPDLVEIEKGSSAFRVDRRTGVTVLRFAGGRGLALAPTTRVIRSSGYSIEVLFRFDRLDGFRKIIDFKDGSADDGLYALDGCLIFFPNEQDVLTRFGSDSYVQVVLTRDAADRVVGYVDGVRQFAFHDRDGLAKVSGSDGLRFFVDDVTTTGEWSSGAVAQIRVFGQALTANEVALLACTELAIADPAFPCHGLE
jgi:concanavalin A-like lectin/glucanase superfamily protein